MSSTEATKELPGSFPLEKPNDDFEWLHHAFTTGKRIGTKALGARQVSGHRRGVEILDFGGNSFVIVDFRKFYEADPLEQVNIVKRGVNARMVDVLAASMQMPKEKLIGTLGLARATIQRKSSQQTALSSEESSRVMGVSKLIGQAQAMVEESGAPEDFDAATWVAQWLDQPLPALNGRRPGDLMDTAEGQAMVSQLLGRLQSGAYV
ncbi:type II RES/Xre toxin-antitoxin system antitoxin [Variovorax sp. Root318D1]|uniref:type II RES/Xre toxin-antitoxin system antitoxin n=1 Tax=Variovorax sp. Root318D1 TaxID=1736513 RepID=UPI0009E80695|nr:antitoxin Xre/MbcA/ParS toxin-binding domain-containing protein [Variovorax sp. Root318D1]